MKKSNSDDNPYLDESSVEETINNSSKQTKTQHNKNKKRGIVFLTICGVVMLVGIIVIIVMFVGISQI